MARLASRLLVCSTSSSSSLTPLEYERCIAQVHLQEVRRFHAIIDHLQLVLQLLRLTCDEVQLAIGFLRRNSGRDDGAGELVAVPLASPAMIVRSRYVDPLRLPFVTPAQEPHAEAPQDGCRGYG